MPAAGGARGSSKQKHTVHLNLPQSASGDLHHSYHHQHRDETGSKTPGSSHHQSSHHQQHAAVPKQLSIATLMQLKRRLRDVRARLQYQQQPASQMAARGRCENTHETQPQAAAFPVPSEARQVLHNSLRFFLGDQARYCPRACGTLVRMVTEDARRRLKAAASSHRFKIIVTATVMQKARQGAVEASRCLMDTGCDSFVTASLDRPTFVASATAYWFYHE